MLHSFTIDGLQYTWREWNDIKHIDTLVQYNKTKFCTTGASFDIETTRLADNKSTMYVWQFGLGNDTFIGRTWEDFRKFIEILNTKIETGCTLLVYIHNMSFEWQFMKHQLEWNYNKKYNSYDVFATDDRTILYARTGQIEFRDSLILTQMSLDSIPKNYNIPLKKLKGELDYKLIRTKETILSDRELAYCINDVQILVKWFEKYVHSEFFRNNKKLPLTATGIVRNELKTEYKNDPNLKEYKLLIQRAFPSLDLYKSMIKWLFRGGMVHSTAESSNETITRVIYSYDRKSSYIASLLHNKYPSKFVARSPRWFYENYENEKIMSKYCYIGTFHFSNIRTTKGISIESSNKCVKVVNPVWDNGRLVQADELVVCLTEIDYKIYTWFYSWDWFECQSLMVADKIELPTYVRKMLCKYFYNKETTPKDDENYSRNKAKLNSIYGMMVSGLLNDSLQYNPTTGNFTLGDSVEWDKIKRGQILLPQWGIYCTCYSRLSLLTCIAKTYEKSHQNSLYQDTDSNKLDNPLVYSYLYSDYNEREKRANRTMDTFGYDKRVFENLGCFEFEEKIYKSKYLGAKRYLLKYTTYNKDTGKYDFNPHITIAGCRKGTVEKYCKENKIDIFKFFNEKMELDKDTSEKLTTKYNDMGFDEIVIDYQGNTTQVSELSCVTLNEIPFTMSMTEDYLSYIEYVQNKYRNDTTRY